MKAGDTVVCVDNRGVEESLSLNEEYKIFRVQPGRDTIVLETDPIKGDTHGWMAFRFKVVEKIIVQVKFSNYREVCFDVL